MNNLTMLGRIANDLELKQTTDGVSVTNFTLAVDRRTAKEKTTDWIDCVAWRNTAEFICRYFQKGAPIIVTGSLQTRSWEDKEGKKRKSVEVLIENAEFVPGNKTDKPQEAPQEEKFVEVEDEDLPFN